MNALSKKRLTSQQRDAVKKAVVQEYAKYKDKEDAKTKEQVLLLYTIATCIVLEEQLGFGDKRRQRVMQSIYETANNISLDLLSNTCDEGNGEVYDAEWNREILSRYADRFHLKYDESIFD